MDQAVSGWTCASQAIVSVLVVPFALGRLAWRERTANCYIAFATCGLVIISLCTGQAASYTQVFLCCSSLLASHLLGHRAALWWTMGAVISIWCIQLSGEVGGFSHGPLDRLFHYVGVTLVVFLICWQSELFFRDQMRELVDATDSLRESTRLLSLAEETAQVGHWRWHLATDEVKCSRELCEILGLVNRSHAMEISHLLDHFQGEQRQKLDEGLRVAREEKREFVVELTFRLYETTRHVECRAHPEIDREGAVVGIFGIFKDNTERYNAAIQLSESQETLEQLTNRDSLTGLHNRTGFKSELRKAVSQALGANRSGALLLFDIDRFKEINDTLGHPAGDALLKQLATRLADCVGDCKGLARLGGDEFALLIPSVNENSLERVSNEIYTTVATPFRLGDREIDLGFSIGAATFPAQGVSADLLLSSAEIAMYQAKDKQDSIVMYAPSMKDELVRKTKLTERLAHALANEEFRLDYQPQVSVETGDIVGFEALLRWDSEGRTVPPMKFIPHLESTKAIVDVGRWVLREACETGRAWLDKGHQVTMSVNISPVQFRDPGFLHDVFSVLKETSFPPDHLDLEVTESLLIEEVVQTAEVLERLKAYGISISIDDFGTGYSSLAYLKNFPINRLKIDRAFIKDIPNTDDGTIASAIVVLAKNLDLKVLAEGVESPEQLSFISEHGCLEYQGYLFQPPIPADQCTQLLDSVDTANRRSGYADQQTPGPRSA